MRNEHPARRRGPIHRARILALSNTCFHIIEYVYSRHQIRVFTPPHTHYRLSFCGCFHICGAINRTPTAADGLPFRCWRSAIMQRTHREKPTNTNEIHTKHSAKYQQTFREIPTLTHEIGCEHSARRRGPIHRARILTLSNTHIRITKYVHSHHRTHISTLSNTCIHIIEYVYSFHWIRAFALPHTHIRPPFCGCIRICGHDKSDPYGC